MFVVHSFSLFPCIPETKENNTLQKKHVLEHAVPTHSAHLYIVQSGVSWKYGGDFRVKPVALQHFLAIMSHYGGP